MAFYKKFATVFVICLTNYTFAQPTPALFPRGCEVSGFAFRQQFLIINEHGNQTFYLMQNHANHIVELEHVETRADTFMSPKLESTLAPQHWAAFASDVDNYFFRCFVRSKDERIKVDCADYLDICQYPRVKFALSNQGSYWVSTNKSRQQVIHDATTKGIFLHW